MPIQGLTPRMSEAGRIRTGDTTSTEKGKSRPRKLDRFRITSPSKALIEAWAHQYGGEVEPWKDAPGGEQWQVYIEADQIDVIVPREEYGQLDQGMELWKGGTCERRCDGEMEELTGGPCVCPQDVAERVELASKGKACKETTRLRLFAPDIPGSGFWRLETHSYHAARELLGKVNFLLSLIGPSDLGAMGVLRMEHRESKVRLEGGKTQTHKFAVPTLDTMLTPRQLLAARQEQGSLNAPVTEDRPALEAPEQPVTPEKPPRPDLPPELANNPHWPGESQAASPAREPMTDVQRFAMQCSQAGFTDDQRHDFIEQITQGRTRSSKDMVSDELTKARQALMEGVRQSTLNLTPGDNDKAKVATICNIAELPLNVKWNLDQWLVAYKAVKAEYPPPEATKSETAQASADDGSDSSTTNEEPKPEPTQAPLEGEVVTEGADGG